jgi:hypothetical protein
MLTEISHEEIGALIPPFMLQRTAGRLAGVTGFISAIHDSTDGRAAVFNRYFHVRRVVWAARWIVHTLGSKGRVDKERVTWLSWAHDLNRWPFAHNSERGPYPQTPRFEQGNDVSRFFDGTGIGYDERLLKDLIGILEKRPMILTSEGCITLLADMTTGFIEDSLLAVVGLDLIPEFIPVEVSQALLLPMGEDGFVNQLFSLNHRLHVEQDLPLFVEEFDRLFAVCIVRLLSSLGSDPHLVLESNSFQSVRSMVKEKLRKPLFRYNNEKISQGELIRRELMSPMLGLLKDRYIEVLSAVDEFGFLAIAKYMLGWNGAEIQRFYPRLDYVTTFEKGLSFRFVYRSLGS